MYRTDVTAKLQNLNQNSTVSWISLGLFNRALNNPAQELRF